MTNPLVICALLALPVAAAAQEFNTIPFDDAVEKGIITFEATKSFARNGVELVVTNESGQILTLHIPAGQIFFADANLQPQVVTRSKDLVLAPDERYRFGLNARCGNAHVPAAEPGTPFELAGSLPPEGSAILDALEAENLDGLSIVQNIVWMFTNDRPLADLHPGELDAKTYRFVLDAVKSELGSKVPDPGYRVAYEELDGGQRFSGIPKELVGSVPLTVETEEPLAVYLTSPEGEFLRAGALHFPPFRGVDAFEFKIDLSGFGPGEYRVRLTELTDPSAVCGDLAIQL